MTTDLEPEAWAYLRERLGNRVEVHRRDGMSDEDLRRLLPSIHIMLVWGRRGDFRGIDLHAMASLGLVQALLAGIETLPFADLPPGTIVCSGSGALTPSVVEHAWALALAAAKHVVEHTEAMRHGRFPQSRASKLLRGATLVVVGLGTIGGEVARVGRSLGMHTTGVRRSPGGHPYCDRTVAPDALREALRGADLVVLTLPLTPATQGIVGPGELAAMKADAILVNVGRGKLIQEDALYEHLRTHPAFTAALDVWWDYPEGEEGYAARLPFHDLPNVVMTPHVGGAIPGFRTDMARHAVDNISSFLEGRTPRGMVRREDYAPAGVPHTQPAAGTNEGS